MILKRISILNYKNIASADVTLSSKLNCLIGSNGVGKTNFLDAVYMLSFCKSAFCSIDSQLIRHDEDFMVVQGQYLDDGGDETEVYCGMKRGQKKHFKREKKEYRRLSEHLGLIPLVFVSPSDSSLIDGDHYTIAVFITDSMEDDKTNAAIIAQISKAVYDYINEISS